MNKTEMMASIQKVPVRSMILNFLMFLGVVAVAITTPTQETTAILTMLPPEWVAWIQKLGFALIGAKPLITLWGDWLDNGKIDKSFQLLLILAGALMFTSCAKLGITALPPTPDGCFPLQRTNANGQQWAAGPCFNGSGKIDRVYTTWTNKDGVKFAARYYITTGQYNIMYQDSPASPWITYGSKTGISLDFPAGLSLDGSTTGGQIIPAG